MGVKETLFRLDCRGRICRLGVQTADQHKSELSIGRWWLSPQSSPLLPASLVPPEHIRGPPRLDYTRPTPGLMQAEWHERVLAKTARMASFFLLDS